MENIDLVKTIKEIEDYLIPFLKLDADERSLYYHLFRYTRLINKEETIFKISVAPKSVGLSKHMARSRLRIMDKKGCIKIVEIRKDGLKIKVLLPDEIEDCVVEREIEIKPVDIEAINFYSDSKYNTSPQAFLSKHFSGNFSYILGTDYSERPDFVFNMLNAYQNMGKDDKLLTMLAHVDADKYQDDPAALSSLGSLFYSAERYASAERVLLLAMQVIKNPSGPTIATLLATLTAQRKYKQALDLINSSNNKKDALVLCHKANLLYELNDHEKFIKLYTQSINPFEQTYLAECGIYFHKIKGYAQYLQKNYQDALLSLGEYYRNYPNDISAMKGIVAAYRAIGNTEMVEAFAQTIARVAKSNSNRLLTLATRYDLHNLSGKSIDAHALRSIAKDLDAYTEK